MQKYKLKLKSFIFLFSIFYFLFASITQATLNPLVPCGPGTGGPAECTFCQLLTLAENIIDFGLYYIAVPLVVIFTIYGGFIIMTSGDKPEKVSDGRKIITSAVIGLLIALLAWLLIDTILKILAPGAIDQWWNPGSKIQC